MHKQPAKITDTFLGFEDHGLFTAVLHVDYGGSAQGIGCFALGVGSDSRHDLRPTKAAAEFVMRVVEACGARQWEQLRGARIYVLFESEAKFHSLNARPLGIEALPFDVRDPKLFLFDAWQARSKYEHDLEKRLLRDRLVDEKLWICGWSHE